MPNLNVKGDVGRPAPQVGGNVGGASSGSKTFLIVIAAVVVLAIVAFALNKSGVVHLWGKKKAAPAVVNVPQETAEAAVDTSAANQTVAPPAKPAGEENATVIEPPRMGSIAEAKPSVEKHTTVPAGTGKYTVQISSFTEESKAMAQADAYVKAGYEAYVVNIGGWYQVRIGRFESKSEAMAMGEKLTPMLENQYAIVRVGK